MKKRRNFNIIVLILSLLFTLVPLPAYAQAEDVARDDVIGTELELPAVENGVITLEADKTYGAYYTKASNMNAARIIIDQGVTIEGNGAAIFSNIVIATDEPVTIRNVKIQPNKISDTGTYSRKTGISPRGEITYTHVDGKEIPLNYKYDLTIENCTFGNSEDNIPAYRSIYMPEPVKDVSGKSYAPKHKGSSLKVSACTFYHAMYNINLLEADSFTFTDNTFNNNGRTAIQYTITPENKDQIMISGNTFNGSSYALNVTIGGDSNIGAVGNIGKIQNNIFNTDTAINMAVHDLSVEMLTLDYNPGLLLNRISFSRYSANPNFKPEITGPISEELRGNLSYKYPFFFNSNGGSEVAEQAVEADTLAQEPVDPSRATYSFEGWYKDEKLETAWDFTQDPVTDSTTLYAKWSKNTYTVTFLDYDDSILKEEIVEESQGATAPEAPTREGYEFCGWSLSFADVREDTVVKANYKRLPLIVPPTIEADEVLQELKVDGLDKIEELGIFTEEELAQTPSVSLDISVLSEEKLPAEDRQALADYISEDSTESKLKMLLMDISLFKLVGSQDPAQVGELNTEITISFVLPEEFRGIDFDIVRVHAGEVTLLGYDYDEETGVVSFTSDKFSTFALVESLSTSEPPVDAEEPDETKVPVEKLPKTGSYYNYFPALCLVFSGAALILMSSLKKRKLN